MAKIGEESYEFPGFIEYMAELEEPQTARDFLNHLFDIGWMIEEIPVGTSVDQLTDAEVIDLGQTYWGMYYLDEYPHYGEFEQ